MIKSGKFPMKKIKLNLRGKLIVIVVVGVIIIFSGIGMFRINQENHKIEAQLISSGQERIALIGESLANMIVTYDYSNIEAIAERVVTLQDVQEIYIYNGSGKLMASRKSADSDPETKGLEFNSNVFIAGNTIGRVQLFLSTQRFRESMQLTYRNIILTTLIVASFFGVLIYATVSKFIITPLSRLSHAADLLALGNYDAALPPASDDEIGNLVYTFSAMREARKLSEARLIAVFENAPDAFIQLDENGIVTDWNNNAENIFGYRKDEVIGKVFNMVKADRSSETNGSFQAISHKEENYNVNGMIREVVGQRKDGSRFPVEIRTCEAEFENETVYIISARDVSERNLNETKLQQAMQAAEIANSAKTSFISNMSHEIRTPMNSIIGMTNLALKLQLDEKMRDYLQKIDFSAKHLLSLINDVLDFSKIEANKLELEKLDFNLSSIINNISSQLGHLASNKNLQLIFDMSACMSLPLRGDALRLTQILLNFTSNAIKFTTQGSITLRTQLVREDERAYLLRFEVQDTGIGLEHNEIPQLFQVFHQSDATITRKYGGTGLGLAISKQLVELMGGEIGVTGQPGVGSVFWFMVALEKGDLKTDDVKAEKVDLKKLEGAVVLLVEDNLFNQQVAVETLHEVGVIVMIANNGQEALDEMQKQSFDCVLMDVQMPVMGGLEATRRIRLTPNIANTYIIAMTANAGNEDKTRCFAAGMNDFVSKPISNEQLYAAIAKAFTPREKHEQREKISTATRNPNVLASADKQQAAGAQGYAELCLALELLKGSGDIEQAREIVEKLRTMLEQIELQIKREHV